MPGTELITRRKLAHEVERRLVEGIRTGEYPPGAKLPSERVLMARYGVGRPAIREAMQSLELQGLLRIAHGERARVLVPTPDGVIERVSGAMEQLLGAAPQTLEELKEARLLFETGLVRLAAERATGEGVAALREVLGTGHAARGDGPRFIAADMAFHRQIATLSGNALIAAVSGGMLDWLTRFKRDMVSVPGAEELALEEHGQILDGVAAGDADRAAAAMRNHLTRANALYAALIARGRGGG